MPLESSLLLKTKGITCKNYGNMRQECTPKANSLKLHVKSKCYPCIIPITKYGWKGHPFQYFSSDVTEGVNHEKDIKYSLILYLWYATSWGNVSDDISLVFRMLYKTSDWHVHTFTGKQRGSISKSLWQYYQLNSPTAFPGTVGRKPRRDPIEEENLSTLGDCCGNCECQGWHLNSTPMKHPEQKEQLSLQDFICDWPIICSEVGTYNCKMDSNHTENMNPTAVIQILAYDISLQVPYCMEIPLKWYGGSNTFMMFQRVARCELSRRSIRQPHHPKTVSWELGGGDWEDSVTKNCGLTQGLLLPPSHQLAAARIKIAEAFAKHLS